MQKNNINMLLAPEPSLVCINKPLQEIKTRNEDGSIVSIKKSQLPKLNASHCGRFRLHALQQTLQYFVGLIQGFPTRDATQHLRGCEMVIRIFVMHYCTVMLSSSCVNCSAQSVSNYSMPSVRPSIQPEMMLISKNKKGQHMRFQL